MNNQKKSIAVVEHMQRFGLHKHSTTNETKNEVNANELGIEMNEKK